MQAAAMCGSLFQLATAKWICYTGWERIQPINGNEVKSMIENFDTKLREYAHLLVEVGMNVQPGQTPRIVGTVDCAPLVRLCVDAALEAGARDVIVDWSDDYVTRQRYLRAFCWALAPDSAMRFTVYFPVSA